MLNKSVKLLSICVATLMMTSCKTVGPDYQQPELTVIPTTWNHKLGKLETTPKAQNQSWWLQFNDPVISQLVTDLRTGSLDLKIAMSRVDEAAAQSGIAKADRYPDVNLSASSQVVRESEEVTGQSTRSDTFDSIGSNASWELDVWGRVRRSVEAADASFQASEEDYRDVLVVLQAEIIRNYIEVRTLQNRIDLAQKNIKNQEDTFNIVKARHEAELVPEIDVLRAEQNVEASKSVVPTLKTSLERAMNRVAVLSGKAPGSVHDLLSSSSQIIPTFPEQVYLGVPRDLLRQRPDIRSAERELAAQTARIGVATADLYPRFTLSGEFLLKSISGGLLGGSAASWAFGPSVGWNIFDGGRKKSKIELEDARAEQSRSRYEKTVLEAFEEVENNIYAVNQEKVRLTHLHKSANAALKSVKLAKERYTNGLTNFQDVLDAERVLFQQQDLLADSKGASFRYLVELYRAMGGGWQN